MGRAVGIRLIDLLMFVLPKENRINTFGHFIFVLINRCAPIAVPYYKLLCTLALQLWQPN